MYLDTQRPKECCGCTACMSICPKSAIEMKADNHGFLAPVIDKEKCIQCDLCRKVCDFNREDIPFNTVIAAYGMHHKEESVLRSSRSGGAFYMLAQQILNMSGIVWGAAFDDNLNVIHKEVRTSEELRTIQGSKYVQSNLKAAFNQIKKTLDSDRWVLFSGTACQVAGLLSYLNMQNVETTKLITCDIICQGVPSPEVFNNYKKYLEEKYNDKLHDFNFRDPQRIGWKGHEESFTFKAKNKRYFSREYTNYYYYYMRESCFSCKYAGTHRPGDFSLGDFWSIDANYPYFYNEEGNSLILINTEKGLRHRVILTLLYDSGCRVQELCDMAIGDIQTGDNPTVRLHGKGNKYRTVAIARNTAKLVSEYIKRQRRTVSVDQPLAVNQRQAKLSRDVLC